MTYEDLLTSPPFPTDPEGRASRFRLALAEAFDWHFAACEPYRRFCSKRGVTALTGDFDLAQVPFLPVGLFKQMRLSSVPEDSVVRTLRSSATTSQTPSTVVLDNLTRTRQVRTLSWIFSDFFGRDRRPFVICDVDPTLASGVAPVISARSAALRGFLLAASETSYCLLADERGELEVDFAALERALTARDGGKLILFGFTYVLYASVVRPLLAANRRFSLPDATVIHIGGWKKLQDQAVDKQQFNRDVAGAFGTSPERVIDIYGFTEQLGLIYPDCSAGKKHCPASAEVIARDPDTLEPVPDGEVGLLEFLTPLPRSYPGIAILLDDLGRVARERCSCGRLGPTFEVIGRAKHAEVRGCGDIFAEQLRPA